VESLGRLLLLSLFVVVCCCLLLFVVGCWLFIIYMGIRVVYKVVFLQDTTYQPFVQTWVQPCTIKRVQVLGVEWDEAHYLPPPIDATLASLVHTLKSMRC